MRWHANGRDGRLAAVLSIALWVAVSPVASAGEIEKRTGWLNVVWGDGFQTGLETYQRAMLRGDDGELTELEIGGALASGVHRWQGQRVEAFIERFVDGSLPRVRSVRSLDGGGASRGARGGVSGSQPWVSVLCKFSDIADEPEDLAFFQDMYGNSPGQLDHYWRELSYGAIDVVGSTAVDWVTLPNPQSFYIPTPGSGANANLGALFNACTAAADPFVDFSNGGDPFVGINLMFNGVLDCCAWGGSFFATLDGISKSWRTTWDPPWAFADEGIIAHEMGHGFGLPHSNNWDGDGNPYDSPWDVMSSAVGYAVFDPVYGRLGKHVHSHHKDVLGWIAPGQKFVASEGTTETIVVDPLALASTSNYRMATVPIPGSSRFYTVEARDLLGDYDGAVPGNAVIIAEVATGRSEPIWVVDSDVPPANYGDNEGSMWRVGESFVDSANDIQIEVLAATANGFQVRIGSGTLGMIFSDGFESGDATAWN